MCLKGTIWAVALSILVCAKVLAIENQLTITQGALTASGNLQVPIAFDKQGRGFIAISAAPTIGYFVTDGFEISGGPILSGAVWESNPQRPQDLNWGILLQGKYYFRLADSVYSYVGIGVSGKVPGTQYDNTFASLLASIGILLPLNNWVALVVGLPVELRFTPRARFYRYEISPGYLGVQAFF